MIDQHDNWMTTALDEARRGWGMTSPNPMVGAVVVRDGVEVGRGYHHRAGTPHAEIHALTAARDKARGADMFVTLEPCCTHGRTPPCTDAIRAAGIKRLFVGSLDPNPRHAGKGVAILREAGIEVNTGLLKSECDRLNEAFFHWITTGRAFVQLKMAMTLDGKIATKNGQSQWITGPEARAEVQRLRRWCDAIMVGAETARRDNPSLTVREPADWPRQPRPYVWTRQPALPADLRLNTGEGRTVGLCAAQSREDWLAWLTTLGAANVTAVLVEGGGELAANLLAAQVVSRVTFFIAPKILGGQDSRPVVGGANPLSLAEARPLANVDIQQVGADIMITGRLAD
ncbi:MAG: bifunctional diaminohydroxyphosphoribosylaminopyrimidine deaminase/5-amino-6-(5-phosphoribosylamino)uracil reductase RibD [Lentisphaeria bacterium]|nr:bifunctional diaminohydroxyphosphoribosylaminopyrimidine deaminase/5-amino-6-(5-phosphoribosylamino)uracil reductase RibD [Lentisphaeria bacterium]